MRYSKVQKGIFLSRPNRFVAHVLIDGKEHIVHVKNTGRCREILQPGVKVYLEDFTDDLRHRKTKYSLVAAEKPDSTFESGYRLINIDSQAPNQAVAEALESSVIQLPGFESGIKHIKAEHVFGSSRFDFYVEGRNDEKALIEVKGVTLEKQGATLFPDAPTERGVKHIYELIEAVDRGFNAFVIFIIQMQDVLYFAPNDDMHLAFGQALREAAKKGVQVLAYDCRVTESTMDVRQEVAVRLSGALDLV